MTVFDPISQGINVLQDTPPIDALVISYMPSEFSDMVANAAQILDDASTRSFMQDQWRMVTENMYDLGNVVSLWG